MSFDPDKKIAELEGVAQKLLEEFDNQTKGKSLEIRNYALRAAQRYNEITRTQLVIWEAKQHAPKQG